MATATCVTSAHAAPAALPVPDHIVIVLEENHGYSDVIGSPQAPYMNALAQAGALFTDSHAIEHPSQPNYLDLFSGSNQGIHDDSCPHSFDTANEGSELLEAGYSFAGYSEDLPEKGSLVCKYGAYARKHAPWTNFLNLPKKTNLPFTSFPTNYRKLPTVSWVIPNLDNDMHDGTIKQADDWLKNNLKGYVKWAAKHNSLLILTWDEDDRSEGNRIPTIFVGPMVKPGQYGESIDHYNVLRTILDMYGLAPLGNTQSAKPIKDVWQ
ncbi:MAG: acid phosphatase [Alphaproteobacteria bacterium]|nr:acid phosphatase [Alphaproteobacteria bacterium]